MSDRTGLGSLHHLQRVSTPDSDQDMHPSWATFPDADSDNEVDVDAASASLVKPLSTLDQHRGKQPPPSGLLTPRSLSAAPSSPTSASIPLILPFSKSRLSPLDESIALTVSPISKPSDRQPQKKRRKTQIYSTNQSHSAASPVFLLPDAKIFNNIPPSVLYGSQLRLDNYKSVSLSSGTLSAEGSSAQKFHQSLKTLFGLDDLSAGSGKRPKINKGRRSQSSEILSRDSSLPPRARQLRTWNSSTALSSQEPSPEIICSESSTVNHYNNTLSLDGSIHSALTATTEAVKVWIVLLRKLVKGKTALSLEEIHSLPEIFEALENILLVQKTYDLFDELASEIIQLLEQIMSLDPSLLTFDSEQSFQETAEMILRTVRDAEN